jgi:hypothetical protein
VTISKKAVKPFLNKRTSKKEGYITMSNEPKINKTTAYLAATGAFATGAFLLTAAPFVTIPLVAVAVVGVAVRNDRAEFLGRVKNDVKEFWSDLSTHATKDYNGLRNWWNSLSQKPQAEAPRAPQPTEAPSTFDPAATAKKDFGQSVSHDGQTAEQKPAPTPVAAPAAKPNTLG